ncbi:MAG: ABC transporter ATP-binding protein, partial [Verrucomicrobiota bacterium]|nr:ABC transporter ATP-binding protein [Verrucomicrobiota bacterium]
MAIKAIAKNKNSPNKTHAKTRRRTFGAGIAATYALGARKVQKKQSDKSSPSEILSPVLELDDISLHAGDPDLLLLNEISASFRPGTFSAILGPSGSGKSLFLKVVAGLREPVAGAVLWEKRDLAVEEDLAPHEVGYVPQFSIAYDLLSVRENLGAALRLRVAGLTALESSDRLEKILVETGLESIAERRVSVLSGGQRRRLSLALEIVTSPALLLCDEVTSGLDPKAEDDIVRLMARLAHEDRRIVLSVTHSLRHLDLYDTLVVLYEGHLAYHGPAALLLHYFSLNSAEELFPRLGERPAAEWHRSWLKHRDAYWAANTDVDEKAVASENNDEDEDEGKDERTPSAWSQFCVLLARRWRLFFRDRSQFLLQLALLFGFPFLVVIFALDGLPQIKNLNMSAGTNPLE